MRTTLKKLKIPIAKAVEKANIPSYSNYFEFDLNACNHYAVNLIFNRESVASIVILEGGKTFKGSVIKVVPHDLSTQVVVDYNGLED